MPKRKESVLSENSELVSLWLKEQPDPKDAGKEYSYDYIKAALKSYLSPESEEEAPLTSTTEEDSEEEAPKKAAPAKTEDYKLETKKKSTDSAESKFNALFDEDDD